MKKNISLCLLFTLVSLNAWSMNSRNLTILAEPNMVKALTKIARIYSQQSNVITSLNFESAVDLVNEIEVGEPADIFISAHGQSIDNLKQKGLIDVYSVSYVAQDQLVLVTAGSNSAMPQELLKSGISFNEALKILDDNRLSLMIDGEDCSSGKFSADFIEAKALRNLNLIKRKDKDRKSITSFLKNNPEYYALLLRSQVEKDVDLKVLATNKENNVFYQALVIAGDSMEVAREFLKFLKGAKARDIMVKEGFVVN